MSSEILENTLVSLCLLVVDCPHATPKWKNDGVIVLRNQNIKCGRLDLSNPSFTDEGHYQGRVKRAVPQAGDIVITREAPMGDVCQIPKGLKCCLGQRQVLLRPDPKKIDGRFLLFALQSPYIQHQIGWSEGTGSTVSNLRIPVLEALKIPTPSLNLQLKIATILGALDDRIDLLRETNKTLEEIAQAIFKSWFVDFDPVRAKQEGRELEGMDADTAALFPDSFEESELGLIPKGWMVGVFRELAHLHKGSINPLNHMDTIFEHYSLPAFDKGQMPINEAGTGIKSNKTTMPINSVLLSKLNPHIPRIWLPSEIGKNAVCSTEFLVFIPVGGTSKEFIYCYFTTDFFKQLLCQLVTGTSNSHQRVKPDAVSNMPTFIPSVDVLKAFGVLMNPIFEQIRHSRQTVQTLNQLRDTLLPRLISGQLRLPDAESMVKEATA